MRRGALAAALMLAPVLSLAASAGRGAPLAERFRGADADGNGTLSRTEAGMALPGLARDFDAIDFNRDGQISPEEIRAHRRAGRKSARAGRGAGRTGTKFEAYFARADADGDGVLSGAEAERGMPRIAGKFGRIDRDGDGRITLEEMRAWLELKRSARGG